MNAIQPPPSVGYGFTIRLAYPNWIGTLAQIVSMIGKHGGGSWAVRWPWGQQ